jgi:hypothetical protein
MNPSEQNKINTCYAKLVEAVVYSSVTPTIDEAQKARNIKFANSKLLHHYCDVWGYDFEVISKKIIERNTKSYPQPFN